MKIFLVVLCTCVSTILFGQKFEGRIKYTIQMESPDTASQARMAKAKKVLRDPKSASTLDEHATKLNDPKMMGTRDQANRKLLRESEMALRGLGRYPTGMTLSAKNGMVLMEFDSIYPDYKILLLSDTASKIVLDHKQKKYFQMPARTGRGSTDSTAVITKTQETANILGYTCTKYVVTKNRAPFPITQEFWITEEIKGVNTKVLSSQAVATPVWLLARVPGVPLKMTSKSREGNVSMEATEVVKQIVDKTLFSIPQGYQKLRPNQVIR
jgi:hypothetical protein